MRFYWKLRAGERDSHNTLLCVIRSSLNASSISPSNGSLIASSFLRICEDRGIEDYGRLRTLLNGERVYPRLCQLFQNADDRYNSDLFHFKREKGRHEPPDELTLVDRMLALHRQQAGVRTPSEQTALDRQIATTDAQIDRL